MAKVFRMNPNQHLLGPQFYWKNILNQKYVCKEMHVLNKMNTHESILQVKSYNIMSNSESPCVPPPNNSPCFSLYIYHKFM